MSDVEFEEIKNIPVSASNKKQYILLIVAIALIVISIVIIIFYGFRKKPNATLKQKYQNVKPTTVEVQLPQQ